MSESIGFIEKLKNAVNLEQKSDVLLTNSYLESFSSKKLAQFGLAVVNLVVDNVKTGLGGKTLLELVVDPALKNNDDIQLGSLRVGDIVKLDKMSSAESLKSKKAQENSSKGASPEDESLDAVVIKTSSQSITISIEEDSTEDKVMNLYNNTSNDGVRMWIVKLSNSITYKRMISTLNKLAELDNNHNNDIVKLLLGQTKYVPRGSNANVKSFFDSNLNESQKNAINFAIHDSPITIIHGPPGTGKTYTLIELIKQLTFNHGERVLVCGPSNISVDTILERLSPIFLIRIGHPARLLANNLQHSLDILSKTSFGADPSDNKSILRDIEKDIGETLGKIKKCKRYSERRVLWGELKQFKKELRIREKKIVQDILVNSRVVLSTLHGAGSYELTSLYKEDSLNFNHENPLFDTIIIDEVSQSLEPQCWIPLVNHIGFKRLVIAGDNKQLPPTIKSKEEVERLLGNLSLDNISKQKEPEANTANLELTLFDRLVRDHEGDKFKKLLDTQYRMNEAIMKFPSLELYEGKLKAHESVRNIKLTDLPNIDENDDTLATCVWYDTQGGDFPERTSGEDDDKNAGARSGGLVEAGSKYNEMEALLVVKHLKKLLGYGVAPEHIGVISPYSAQVNIVKKALQHEASAYSRIEVSTVDGFQGREKEIIIISLVRSNDAFEVGFLRDERRLNVAMTRPKRQLCVVGNIEVIGQSGFGFLEKWAAYVEDGDNGYEVYYPDLGDY
ncbi:DNA helicase [Suhomyces tanzawaensis NRRL Y-17324]|uniref:DNA helicase n=1 Tax=Suhomyces tanzawaensis NRRL Y-17324 TaxID=984487 RepID=A0A1E4SD99_9ASCO|nr:DNA helicase [Suhomyces tanzawaensis NRRL Y-17324]ODV77489.1 DNA helicase [Suhomyces tanzawaensis NRRL Y-17324]